MTLYILKHWKSCVCETWSTSSTLFSATGFLFFSVT